MPRKPSIIYEKYFDCKLPEFCYLLGYLWADGGLTSNNKTYRLGIVEEDGKVLKDILDSIEIHYTLHYRKASFVNDISRKPVLIFLFGKGLVNFLMNFNYKNKSFCSPQAIMEFIPKENLHYWMRGYFDGDGCFYKSINAKKKQRYTCISSSYNQDWSYLINFLNTLNVFPNVRRIKSKAGKKSNIKFSSYESINNFGSFIYKGKQFGLNRKNQKFKDIIKDLSLSKRLHKHTLPN